MPPLLLLLLLLLPLASANLQLTGAAQHAPLAPPIYSTAMMTRPELSLLRSYMHPSNIYLEYGSGGSTQNVSPLVHATYSIDHNCAWSKHILSNLPANSLLHPICINPSDPSWGYYSPFEHASYAQFHSYVNAPTNLSLRFDTVLIDGRARVACALTVLPILAQHGLVFVHDFYARLDIYQPLLPFYEEVARVRAVRNRDPFMGPLDQPQGMVVLRKKNGVPPPNEMDIHKLYQGDAWRVPFGKPVDGFISFLKYLIWNLDVGVWRRAKTVNALVAIVRKDVLCMAALYAVLARLHRRCI